MAYNYDISIPDLTGLTTAASKRLESAYGDEETWAKLLRQQRQAELANKAAQGLGDVEPFTGVRQPETEEAWANAWLKNQAQRAKEQIDAMAAYKSAYMTEPAFRLLQADSEARQNLAQEEQKWKELAGIGGAGGNVIDWLVRMLAGGAGTTGTTGGAGTSRTSGTSILGSALGTLAGGGGTLYNWLKNLFGSPSTSDLLGSLTPDEFNQIEQVMAANPGMNTEEAIAQIKAGRTGGMGGGGGGALGPLPVGTALEQAYNALVSSGAMGSTTAAAGAGLSAEEAALLAFAEQVSGGGAGTATYSALVAAGVPEATAASIALSSASGFGGGLAGGMTAAEFAAMEGLQAAGVAGATGAAATGAGAGAGGLGLSAFAMPAAVIAGIVGTIYGIKGAQATSDRARELVRQWYVNERQNYQGDVGRLINEAVNAANSGGWGNQILTKYMMWGADEGWWKNVPWSDLPAVAARSLITEMENTGKLPTGFRQKFETSLRDWMGEGTGGLAGSVSNAMQDASTGTWRESEIYANIHPAAIPGILPELTTAQWKAAEPVSGSIGEIEWARAQLAPGVGRRVFEEYLDTGQGVSPALAMGRDAEWRASTTYLNAYLSEHGAELGWMPPLSPA